MPKPTRQPARPRSRRLSRRHAANRGRLGRRLAVALLIPAGTAGGLVALGPNEGPASAALSVKLSPEVPGTTSSAQLRRGRSQASVSRPVGPASAGPDSAVSDSRVSDLPVLDPPVSEQAGVAWLIDRVFPPGARQQARAIAWCESRLDPGIVGPMNLDGTHDWGVFQLNDGGTLQSLGGTPAMALDARWNVLAAKRLYDEHGFAPWSCRRQS